ncbi:hypothetical protein FLAVO9R_30218 [Flavobacterium sp. 9R]|uniref:hypothetical protein n=1 Tax=Flavobacterium sp. 9R TaxID=2653143 RepID=UPI0012EFBAE2|nr:hypothetical protein [Flavobacterium sp. 9R]VXB71511.1 hypothetical protein FLAVO9R_30218 [Flavobacterium sp. 9R]
MKKNYALGVLFATFLFIGCSNDEDEIPKNVQKSKVAATIDGKAWAGDVQYANLITVKENEIQNLNLIVDDANYKVMIGVLEPINLTPSSILKDYDFTDSFMGSNGRAVFKLIKKVNKKEITYFPIKGYLTYTAIDLNKKTFSGTFSFETKIQESKNISKDAPEKITITGTFSEVNFLTKTISKN